MATKITKFCPLFFFEDTPNKKHTLVIARPILRPNYFWTVVIRERKLLSFLIISPRERVWKEKVR
jgi:hypothetical protein